MAEPVLDKLFSSAGSNARTTNFAWQASRARLPSRRCFPLRRQRLRPESAPALRERCVSRQEGPVQT
jgi:hypothetical protein